MKTFLIAVLFASSLFVQAQAPVKNAQPARMGTSAQIAKTQAQVDPLVLLQAQTRVMRAQIQELKRQIDFLVRDSQTAKANVPHCSADLHTSSSPQGLRDCSPYMCDPVVGSCLMSCATTDDCTPGTACDLNPARCVRY